jgi:hypothetical protein
LLERPSASIFEAMRIALPALWFALSAPLLVAACAAQPERRPDEPLIDERAALSRSPSAAAPAAPSPARGAPGEIPRADYERVLAGSPGAFLARVAVEPTFRLRGDASKPQFAGWRVRALDPQLAGALHAGDVVVRVNGHSVEQPDQFLDAWQAARGQKQLVVEILREGRAQRLTWAIVER